MSDNEFEVSLTASNGTLELFDVENILQILLDAASDAIETKDFLSYSTVLDIHLLDPARFTNEERETLLQRLLDNLSENHELLYEVGWDIPALVLPFVDSDFEFLGPIRSAPNVYKVLKIFEVLALHGNAKELFLKSTELLSTLKISDGYDNHDHASNFFGIKLYCIFELISSTLRRIHTLYPSRFLAMTVSSFVNCAYNNPAEDMSSFNFIMKRMFVFARNYVSPPKPESSDLSAAELAKIENDENFLQRKLLTALLTESIYIVLRRETMGFTVSYFNYIHKLHGGSQRPALDYTLDLPVMTRLYELALSFDLTPHTEFVDFVALSEELVALSSLEAANDESFTGDLFEKLVIDFQNVFGNCLVNSKTGYVTDSLGGSLLLYTYDAGSKNGSEAPDVTMKQAVAMVIRLLVPGIVHKSLYHKALLDMAVFWCWYAVQNLHQRPEALELELSSIPKTIILIFAQALLFGITSLSPESQLRYLALTLFTKVLSAAPEDVVYTFLINSLRDCPFKGAKPVLVGVLRVLLISDKKVDEITAKLEKLKVNSNQSKQIPPALPTRELGKSSKFITLTENRAKDILALVDQHIKLTFEKENTGNVSKVNFEYLSTLLGLLNLLIPLRQSPHVKSENLVEISQEIEKNVSSVEGQYNGDGAQSVSLNAVTVLRVALGRLSE